MYGYHFSVSAVSWQDSDSERYQFSDDGKVKLNGEAEPNPLFPVRRNVWLSFVAMTASCDAYK